MDLGTKLQQFRKSNGLSLRELSSLTNLSISFLSDIEHNRSYPSILTLKVISEKLSVPISILLDDEPYSPDYKSLNLSDILLLLDDFSSWKNEDKLELFYYLKAKNTLREIDKNTD
ncbi:helix-turn-helix transcriptional regulator [Clostridium sp. NSJ-6]|uniref:Helix-turn-helix transcriptional regulator n=1 Tax=Clostridium hominis TaxID=2763036 RepID=A0ABR7DBC5_9CLOT|nr:helix-turn-helix transcriptional regulator [Clostridium hominis]MBC5628694.1 helix-turn-helix transcriptional regulator [Clostridium hominis]MDU2674013.1 helix-turn-helix transcriptional regulator [Clostridium sp.]